MRSQRGPGFNLILKIDRSATSGWLWTSVIGILVALAIGKGASIYGGGFVYKVAGFFAFLIITFLCGILFTYIARLHFTDKNRLELNEDGLYDFASYCYIGFVPMKAIDKIRFAKLGVNFLVVEFFVGQNPVLKARGLTVEIYRLLFGDQLWVPLNLFKMSRFDLESQLIHLDHILREKTASGIPAPNEIYLSPPKLSAVATENQSSKKGSLAQRASSKELAPPPLNQATGEKARVLQHVGRIKQEVKESRFDIQVAHLYFDHIAMFPALAANSADHLPSGVSHVSSLQEGADYEEVSFMMKGKPFIFGLRRDIGKSDEALLSVGVSGRVHLSLRVRVEIGELTPLELESYIDGDWKQTIEDLMNEILKQENKRQSPFKEGSDTVIGEKPTGTNLEDLKNRFGIKE